MKMSEAEKERAAIVMWLRALSGRSTHFGSAVTDSKLFYSGIADDLENGNPTLDVCRKNVESIAVSGDRLNKILSM